MSAIIDWEFIRGFHPLPPSDRRTLLRAMGVDGISHFDDRQFFGWLAERYRFGEGPQIDAVIQRKLNKADERGLEPVLYAWLWGCTDGARRRRGDRRATIRWMTKDVLAKGGDNAARLRALAPNYPWLELPGEKPGAHDESRPEVPSVLAYEVDTSTAAAQVNSKPNAPSAADEILDRLTAALVLLRERPDPSLLEHAGTFADAIETYAAIAERDEADNAYLKTRREGLVEALAALDEQIAGQFSRLEVDRLTLEAIDRIEAALSALDQANYTLVKTRADMVASLDDASEDDRSAALEAYNSSRQRRDAAITAVVDTVAAANESRIAEACPPIGDVSTPNSSQSTSMSATRDPTSRERIVEGIDAIAPIGGPVDRDNDAADETPIQLSLDTAVADIREVETPSAGVADNAAASDNGEDGAPNLVFQPNLEPTALNPEETPLSVFGGDPDATETPVATFCTWDGWIEAALLAERLGLAVHLADGQEFAGAEQFESLSSAAIEGVLRGNAVQTVYSRAWAEYDDLRERLLIAAKNGGGSSNARNHLLLFAGAIRPAIVQSQSALALLDTIEGEVAAALQPLSSALEHVAELRVESIAQIAATPDQARKQEQIAELRGQIQDWWTNAPKRRMNYQPATAVWQELVSNGPLGRAAALVVSGTQGAAPSVRDIIETLENESDEAIDAAHERLTKGARRDPIEGNARKHLHGQIVGALELFGKWVTAEMQLGAREDRLHLDRERLLSAISVARDSISVLIDGNTGLSAAGKLFDCVLRSIEGQLRGTVDPPPSAEETLDWEIALLPRFPLNSRVGFRVAPEDVEDLAAAATAAIQPDVPTVDQAFEEGLRLGAASSAARLVDRVSPAHSDTAQDALARTVTAARRALLERMQSMRQLLDDIQIATTEQSGELEELERAMTSFEQLQVSELPRDIGDALTVADFPTANRDLDRIQRMLEKARKPIRESLAKRIAALELRFAQPLDDCRAQLDCDDLGTLSEEVDQIEKHGLAGHSEPAALDLLTQFAELLSVFADRPSIDWGNLSKTIREGGQLDALDFSELKEFDRERAIELVTAFVQLRRAFSAPVRRSDKQIEPAERVGQEIAKVLRAIGWASVRVHEGKRELSWYRYSMSSVALRSRDDCPVPAFGSERLRVSDGRAHYALVVAGPDDTDACISALDRLPDKVLLFFTTALDSRQRRDILRKIRRSTRSVAVADGVTIAMLAATRDRRLKHFFELAIPMGGAQPYADKGAETAIENFFGRQKEINSLVDPDGPSFVYGGRQLGKTALLKQIELRENDNEDRVAVFCDIKPIGESEPAEAVWDRIYVKLRDRKISLPPRGGSIAERLKGWAEEKPGRFLLIMLDEADAFLASEMEQNFPQIRGMKELMEVTRRGVKFVFAGLHNVQRFYRAPNSPLLHWGNPVNVGPLLGSDRLAARQMALEPMAALGFRFERTTDAYHMLSLVGFYPSLMQSFGKAVVSAVNAQLAAKGDPFTLPATITRRTIEECFKEQTFRDGVTYRFQETLKLDERYELITYAVWDRMQDDSDGGRTTTFGYSASEISRLARTWWPAGFAETGSLESFTAILDEMVEMGVLARKGDHYALRSQRIAAMLGDEAEIGIRLQNLIDSEPRRRPDPMLSHRQIDGTWSPLTLRQEAALHATLANPSGPRIVLVSGARATGLTHLPNGIHALLTGPAIAWPSPRRLLTPRPDLIATATKMLRSDATREAPGIVIIEREWPSIDALHALRKERALRESLRPVRLIFCGLPTASVLAALPAMPDVLHVQVGPLTSEAMLHWMNYKHIAFADEKLVQAQLRAASGGFLEVLAAAQLDSAATMTSDSLIEAVEASASKTSVDDLGLVGSSLSFARELLQAAGSEAVSAQELGLWANEVGGDDGADQLRLLDMLGIVETVPVPGQTQMQAFNPLALRLIA